MESIKDIIPDSESVQKAIRTLQFKDKWLNKGFTQISNGLLRDNSVNTQARFVYFLLMSRVFQKDFAYPGQDTLGKEMGISGRQIRNLLKELIEGGWVEVERRGQGKTNIYFLKKF